jgi:uncharacterized membrane protein
MLCAAIAYTVLQYRIILAQGPDSLLAQAVGRDRKGRLSLLCYVLAIPTAYLNRWLAVAFYVTVAAIWLVPDRRIEQLVNRER